MPTSTEPDTGAIHRVLLDSGADPKLIHPAIEEIRHLSGQNVIAAIGAQITELRSETQAQFTELRAEMNTLNTETQAQIHRASGGDEHPEHGDLASSDHRAPL